MQFSIPQQLSCDHVHLWIAALDVADAERERLWKTLSVDEQQRALRFRFAVHRERYIAGRGILRQILGTYLDHDPMLIVFASGQHGKPELGDPSKGSSISFNVSHSDALAAYAFAAGRRVGVDIEKVRQIEHLNKMAQQFAQEEQAELNAVANEQRDKAFLACWTRKEAYLKAHGLGLSVSLGAFATSGVGTPRLTRVDWDSKEVSRWTFRQFTPAANYVGTLVVEGGAYHLTTGVWPSG